MYSSTTNNSFEVVDQVHIIYTLTSPHYIVLTSIETSPSSMWATMVILNSVCEYNIICRSFLPLHWQHRVWADYKQFLQRGCQRKSPTDCTSRYLTHTTWKCCLEHYRPGCWLFHSGSSHWHSIYISPRQLCLLYRSTSRSYWRQDIALWRQLEQPFRRTSEIYRWLQCTDDGHTN